MAHDLVSINLACNKLPLDIFSNL